MLFLQGFNPLCNGAGFATHFCGVAACGSGERFNPLCNGAGFATAALLALSVGAGLMFQSPV